MRRTDIVKLLCFRDSNLFNWLQEHIGNVFHQFTVTTYHTVKALDGCNTILERHSLANFLYLPVVPAVAYIV
jgi:hypothetical protein